VAANVAQGLQLGTDLTGIDVPKLLARLAGGAGAGAQPAVDAGNGQAAAVSKP
jgi:flotillin